MVSGWWFCWWNGREYHILCEVVCDSVDAMILHKICHLEVAVMKELNKKVFGFGKTGLMCVALVWLMGSTVGCEKEEFELDEMGDACPPKIMQKDGYLVCEGPVQNGVDTETGFFFPHPTFFYCDEDGKNVDENQSNESERIKIADEGVNKYFDWDEYFNWITNEGREYRLTSESDVETLYHQIRKVGYVLVNAMMYDSESGKYKDTFKYGYCPAEAGRCGLDEIENAFFCENLVSCRKSEHYDGVSKCVPDSVEKCGSETNNCTIIAGWKNGECRKGVCLATACDEMGGYSLENGKCNAACMPGQVKCDNKCVDPNTDPNYCGATGTITSCEDKGKMCEGGSVCAGGQCV